MPAPDLRRALLFGRYAEEYARWRPTYPVAAVDWLVPDGASHVADLGAGMGALCGRCDERLRSSGSARRVVRHRRQGV